jgi:Domain of unknown function (DUF4145)
MPINRSFWQGFWFTKKWTPPWPCPTCHHGNLKMVKDSLFEHESIESKRSHGDNDWDPLAYFGVFSCALRCSNDECGDHVAVSGISQAGEEGEYGDQVTCLKPLMFTPALHLLLIPNTCPENVAKEFQEAFKLYWCDRAGGMNHIRKAVELILDHLKIARRIRTKKKTFHRLDLHGRIERFRPKNPALAERLEAVKWLGNLGSHSSEVSHDAFFNACDLLEDFIHTHFEKRGDKIVALAKAVIKRKGRV